MNNDPGSSHPTAFTTNWSCAGLVPTRQRFMAVFVAGLLAGCGALGNPDKVRFTIPGNTSEFKSRIYAGAALGGSQLSPNTQGDAFSADSSSDAATQLRLGYDLHNLLAVEADTAILGTSDLRSSNAGLNASAEVKYSAASISALVYGWGGVQNRSRREGLSAYGRLGFAALSKSSNVIELDDSGVVPIVGVGAEYGFDNGLGIRSELTRYDSDVFYAGFGAVYRFGISPKGIGRMIADAADPALSGNSHAQNQSSSPKETIVERYAGPDARPAGRSAANMHYTSGAEPNADYVGTMANRWRPAMRADDRDQDGVMDYADSCPDTANHVTVDRYGCGLFDAVLHEVTFKSGSNWLTPRARAQLDLLAETLLAFPESRIQVRAHTDSRGAADTNLALSSRRAEVVVLYLQSLGVNELQLQAVGLGEAQPLDSNKTSEGRRRNRRVDIVTLPDQDAGQLLFAANVESNAVMSPQTIGGASGTTQIVAIDDWNTAPKPGKKKRGRKSVTQTTDTVPALMAAMPAPAPAPVTDIDKLLDFSNDVQNTRPLVLKPLPAPGFAPDFHYSGVLSGVQFGSGESQLTNESKKSLQPLLDELQRNPSVRIAVMAHTDNQGISDENKVLSTQRANAVVGWLVDGGVDSNRLKAEGYGDSLPLVQNVTEADRARNRRVEVRVLQAEY